MTHPFTIAFTGHRPPKAGLTYSHNAETDSSVVEEVRYYLRTLREIEGPEAQIRAIVGGALGFDTLAARACWLEGVPYTVAVPFVGQEGRWPQKAQARYHRMLAHAEQVRVISDGGYSAAKMHRRNHWMVDHATQVWALWDGTPGGTSNCVEYALNSGKRVVNLHDSVMERRAS